MKCACNTNGSTYILYGFYFKMRYILESVPWFLKHSKKMNLGPVHTEEIVKDYICINYLGNPLKIAIFKRFSKDFIKIS